MIMVAAMAGLVVVAGVGLLVDDRQLLHESIWAKPFKFGVSFVIYGSTLAWMLSRLRRARRTMWTLGTLFAVTGLVDVGFIVVQAARGTYSHFNVDSDPFNVIGQQVFSSGVVGLFGVSLLIAVMLLFQRVGEPALTWRCARGSRSRPSAWRWRSSSSARTRTRRGRSRTRTATRSRSSDSTGWAWPTVAACRSRTGARWVATCASRISSACTPSRSSRSRRWPSPPSQPGSPGCAASACARLTGVVVLGYTGLFVITAWQAMRGESLVHPDAATWTAVAATLAVLALPAGIVVARARRAAAIPGRVAAMPLSRHDVA
jgi:hypothetical protein